MKGTIVKCLEELVVGQFGKDTWKKSLEDAGLHKLTIFLPMAQVDDSQVVKVVEALCKNLNISLAEAADAFGAYWVNVYAQKLYPQFYARNKTARDFLLDMDNVHLQMTRTMTDAKPPRFHYEWKDDKTLIMHYESHRGLVDFAVGLTKGVGKFYKENLQVAKLGTDRIQIVFA
jgi:hypothetical protein